MKVQVVRGGSLGPGAGQTGKDSLWGAGEDTGVGASGWPGSQTGAGCGGRTRLTEPWVYLFLSWISIFHFGQGGWIWGGHPKGPGEGDRDVRGCP